ncbi:MAG TPA: FAD-dependent oxidoreductase [Baekduia sp.]|jgi:monoamine oxidase|nr:FAD-dependent oxidoreductase [Baekduia sp.]
MARSPLLDGLQDAAARAAADDEGTTRRRFLARTGTLAAGAAVTSWPVRPAFAASQQPRIVVVGAGLAGLTATYRLQQAGYQPQLHEASTRAGGRCWTIRGTFADGQIAEHGGELIDSNHIAMKQLVSELGFQLDNLFQAEQAGTDPVTYFDGRPYTWDDATNDLKGIWQQIHSDVSAASYPTTYHSSTQRGRELDAMSVAQWIANYVPGGAASNLGQLLDVAYNIEYGAETSDQASLNMLYLLGYAGQGNLRIFGKSNEKFHVRGGNDQVSTALAAGIGSALRYGSQLVAVATNADGTQTLSFRQGTKTVSVVADRAILALPFSMLRSVDLTKAAFGTEKRWAIAELGMGTNSKLNLGFSRRHWQTLGNNGDTYADTGYQATWEVSRAQPGTSGILVDYTGGRIGTTFGSGTPQDLAKRFLGQIEPVLPGITAAWDGRATVDAWPTYPWTKGSYSYFKVGQYTRFSGAEAEVAGACHFAGEHTSQDFQGYLNGAVESGQRAASEVLAALKK